MSIIDLLNNIANGEELPQKINYDGRIYNYEDRDYFSSDYGYLFDRYNVSGMLNDEVEILEEEKKIPEKLDIKDIYSCDDYQQIHINFKSTWNKINSIIDYLKSKGE